LACGSYSPTGYKKAAGAGECIFIEKKSKPNKENEKILQLGEYMFLQTNKTFQGRITFILNIPDQEEIKSCW